MYRGGGAQGRRAGYQNSSVVTGHEALREMGPVSGRGEDSLIKPVRSKELVQRVRAGIADVFTSAHCKSIALSASA